MDGATTWPVQGHPGQPATLGIAPLALPTAPSRAGREPYLAFGDPEAHVGLHAGGSATAPWEPRGPGVSSSSCSSSWDLRDGWRGRRRQAGRGGGAGGVPRPRRARVLGAGSPSPRARCSVSPRASPGDPVSPGFLHVTICQLLGSRAPAARRHHLPSPQIPHLYPHWSCEPCSPTESCYNHAPSLRVAR